ncbi:unnamed protein product [Adineta ricciae]|uniref:Uncharacterized protein n=1 Tax=Adineta ricciae TaxID=249248 RepID=A0A813N2X7_ADIRI|nr:unnamed protein product [Adineta ricciae]
MSQNNYECEDEARIAASLSLSSSNDCIRVDAIQKRQYSHLDLNSIEASPSVAPTVNEPVVKNDEANISAAPQSIETNGEKQESNPPSDSPTNKPEEEGDEAVVPQADSPPSATSDVQEQENLASISSKETNKENINSTSREQESSSSSTTTTTKSRSVNFASKIDEIETPRFQSTNSNVNRTNYSSSKSSRRPIDFIDALVESYKLETSVPSPNKEEKKYVPKTNRTRLNPNWREHRTKRLMNKLEELSLWDREEELKATQAQSLRDQKWEQIQDRQRNHDLCLALMRQRHESEMESAVLLDPGATGINDENTSATIARAMSLASPAELLAYDLPTPPHSLKRRLRQEQEKTSDMKTALGRYRQFESTMSNKLEKINQKLQPDHEIMRAYSPYRTAIPPTVTPLFSETYATLLSVPESQPTNKYNQYHYNVASHLHQAQHSASPDYETRSKSYSSRDVRVPLKEQANDYSYYDDENIDEPYHQHHHRSNFLADDEYHAKHRLNTSEYYPKFRSNALDEDYHRKYRFNSVDEDYPSKPRPNPIEDDYYTKYRSTLTSKLDYSPPRRTTSLVSPTASALYDYTTVANAPRDYSFIHSSQPLSNSIHLRSLNDDLNAITRFSSETSKKILQNATDSANDLSSKSRSSSSMSTSKHVSFTDRDGGDDDDSLSLEGSSRNYSSKTMYQQPVEIISLSSSR